jgi:hypothetical protein
LGRDGGRRRRGWHGRGARRRHRDRARARRSDVAVFHDFAAGRTGARASAGPQIAETRRTAASAKAETVRFLLVGDLVVAREVARERERARIGRIVGARDGLHGGPHAGGLAGPRRRLRAAIDAERLEHRLALQNEERSESARHVEALRQGNELGSIGLGAARPFAIGDASGGKEPRHERVSTIAGRPDGERVLGLERLAADLALQRGFPLQVIARDAQRDDRLAAGADRREHLRRDLRGAIR